MNVALGKSPKINKRTLMFIPESKVHNSSWPKLPYHAERTEISGEGSLCFALFYFAIAIVLMGGWSL
jgi:hypothetical protein